MCLLNDKFCSLPRPVTGVQWSIGGIFKDLSNIVCYRPQHLLSYVHCFRFYSWHKTEWCVLSYIDKWCWFPFSFLFLKIYQVRYIFLQRQRYICAVSGWAMYQTRTKVEETWKSCHELCWGMTLNTCGLDGCPVTQSLRHHYVAFVKRRCGIEKKLE